MTNKGITYLEVLMVIAIVFIIGAAVTPFASRFILTNHFETTIDKIVGTSIKARNYAMDRKYGNAWGICKTGTNIRLFSGSCASPGFHEDYDIPTTVTVSDFTNITFSSLNGEPSTTALITVSTYLDTKTITINAAGGIDVN